MTFNEGIGVSNHQQLDYMFDSLMKPTTKESLKLYITGPLWEESGDHWIPLTYYQYFNYFCQCFLSSMDQI